MFDKGELAAILRFGAEDMFKQLDRDDEDIKKRDQQLYGEDIDAILARAEVRAAAFLPMCLDAGGLGISSDGWRNGFSY